MPLAATMATSSNLSGLTDGMAQSSQPPPVSHSSQPASVPSERLAPPATASSLPSLSPLSLAFSSSLYSAMCRDTSLPASDAGLLSFRDTVFEQCSSQYLRLNHCQLGPHSATILSRCLLHSDELSDVREVAVNGTALRSYGLVQLLKAVVKPASKVQVLEVRDNGIGNSGAKEMAKVLVNNTTVSDTNTTHNPAPCSSLSQPLPADDAVCPVISCHWLSCATLISARELETQRGIIGFIARPAHTHTHERGGG